MAAVVVAVSGANAQDFSKGDWLLNANLSGLNMEHSFADGFSTTTFDINAGGAYFLSNKFAIDASLGLNMLKVKDVDAVNIFTIAAGVRYYPVGNLFVRAGYEGLDAGEWASYAGVGVGYDLFLSEKVFFEPAVNFQKNLAKGGENVLGLSLGIGVKF